MTNEQFLAPYASVHYKPLSFLRDQLADGQKQLHRYYPT